MREATLVPEELREETQQEAGSSRCYMPLGALRPRLHASASTPGSAAAGGEERVWGEEEEVRGVRRRSGVRRTRETCRTR